MFDSFEAVAVLPASPEEVYRAWLDSAQHSVFTASPAEVAPYPGGHFSAWDGYIQRTTLETEPYRRILQSWRTSEFPDGSEDSLLEVLLNEVEGGTEIRLIHTRIPSGQGESYLQGWQDYYFSPMRAYFSKE